MQQRAIIGDWVAWKPEIAPQATVMNRNGRIGIPFGWVFARPFQNSGIWYLGLKKITPPTPKAMTKRAIPKTG